VARVIDKPLPKNGDAIEERKLLFQVIRMLLAEGARMSSAMTDGFSFHLLIRLLHWSLVSQAPLQ